MSSSLNKKVVNATKWSSVTGVVSKVIMPISSMILARLLTPEAFGVVATLNMIISFSELFTDAGFQKYLIQHQFASEEDLDQGTNVAFWSNFVMSLLIWGAIAFFADPLAVLVGNPGLGNVITIACISIPLAAFSSIQMALYKRDLDFKTLFKVRMLGIATPLLVTIPLAFWLRNYWALVIGTIANNLINAFFLTFFSRWKPRLYYSFRKLKEMFSFTVWSLFEAISIWLTSYVDVFIVGTMLSQHYLGLYKTSSALVGHIIGMITAATTPILFSSLSKLQYDDNEFKKLFFKFQKIVGMLVVPMGVGIFCYDKLITEITLGEQWLEAAGFVGLWGLTSSITIIYSHYSSEVYRAKGKPRLSVLAQWLHIIVLWPTVYIAVAHGFETLYIARSIVRLEGVVVHMILIYSLMQISFFDMFKNTYPSIVSSIGMAIIAILLNQVADTLVWQLTSFIISSIFYFAFISLFPQERNILMKKLLRR